MSNDNDKIKINNVLRALGRFEECLTSDVAAEKENSTKAVECAIAEDRLIFDVCPPSDDMIDTAVAHVHDEAIKLNTEMFDEMLAEQILMEAASVAQTLAACSSWFPPAAAIFEATAVVSFVGVATDEAIIAARKNKELSYINSIVEHVKQQQELEPMVEYQNAVQNGTNHIQNIGAEPVYARAGLLNICLDLRGEKKPRTEENVLEKISYYNWSSYNSLTPDQKQHICSIIAEMKEQTDPSKLKDLYEEIGKSWPQWLKAGGSLAASMVFGVLTARYGKQWQKARNMAAREAGKPLLDENGEPAVEGGAAAETEEAGLYETYSVRLGGWEIAGSVAAGIVGIIGGIMAGLQIKQIKEQHKEIEDKIISLTTSCSTYYKSVAQTMRKRDKK